MFFENNIVASEIRNVYLLKCLEPRRIIECKQCRKKWFVTERTLRIQDHELLKNPHTSFEELWRFVQSGLTDSFHITGCVFCQKRLKNITKTLSELLWPLLGTKKPSFLKEGFCFF